MKKKFTICLLVISVITFNTMGLSANPARPVSPEKARIIARNFYYERISQTCRINFESLDIKDFKTITQNNEPRYFAINVHRGFVIVSAWENIQP